MFVELIHAQTGRVVCINFDFVECFWENSDDLLQTFVKQRGENPAETQAYQIEYEKLFAVFSEPE